MQYSSGYPLQSQEQQPELPGQQKHMQEVRFYKSSIFWFNSAAGRFQSDCKRMTLEGWELRHTSFLGLDFWLRRIIVATYEK